MKIQEEQAMKLNTICDKLIDKVLSELKLKICLIKIKDLFI